MQLLVYTFVCVGFVYGQNNAANGTANLHNGLSEKIGNFSIELLHHTAQAQPPGQNLIMSPITVWTVLAVIAEGASGTTRSEVNNALRLLAKNTDVTRRDFRNIAQWLVVNTNTVQLAKMNAIFVDKLRLPLEDFKHTAKMNYDTEMIALDFKKPNVAEVVNRAISNVTRGRIPSAVSSDTFQDSQMVLSSALYFKGQWTVPFNASSTSKHPFYDSNGKKIGEVNMMYNRFTYPFSNMRELQARVIELPYGKENRLSMLIMLPNPGVSVEDMFKNFQKVPLDSFFEELRLSKEEFSDDEVDCFIPRFKIESSLDMTEVFKQRFGIQSLFNPTTAQLPFMARTPMYVSKVIHKAEIEVTEEGTTATGVTIAEFTNRIGVVRFEGNRPFSFMIVEKKTNTIVFGGYYKTPILY